MKKILVLLLLFSIVALPMISQADDFSFSQVETDISTNRFSVGIMNNAESSCKMYWGNSINSLNYILSSDHGENFRPANNFHGFLLVDLSPSTNYAYKIVCRTPGGQTFQTAINTFTTLSLNNQTAHVQVVSPNGGESYKVGDTIRISWDQWNQGNSAFILRVKISESSVYPIDFVVDGQWDNKKEPFNSANGRNYYDWKIPFAMPFISKDYKYLIQVIGGNVDLHVQTNDLSDNTFTTYIAIPETNTGNNNINVPPTVPLTNNSEVRTIKNRPLYKRLKGAILIKVEDQGKAYYISSSKEKSYFLGRPQDAFIIMREQGIGIKNNDLIKIPIGLGKLSGGDPDQDGLGDMLEDALLTDKSIADTDGDGINDKVEIINGYNPKASGKMPIDKNFAKSLMGKILLQVEGRGEAWYVNPIDNKRYFLGRADDAFELMRSLGVGINNKDFNKLN